MFPVRLVLQDKYEAAKALKSYSGRVAVLLAGHDEMVPTRFGQALFDGYSAANSCGFNPTPATTRSITIPVRRGGAKYRISSARLTLCA
jgi:hypothetical protein